ncbi:MAG: indole-3-glycerol phosphate synthase TrpC [Rhodomicrobium sp.]
MSILDKIVAYKKEEVAAAKAKVPPSELDERLRAAPPLRDFFEALGQKWARLEPGLIAEVKKASPSKGLIRPDFDPAAIARAYERGGAACLSVLTDGPSFQGSPEALIAAREATSLPVLRKDFLVDPYQVDESRAMGADCILVIMACTPDSLANELFSAGRDRDMSVLVEVHNEDELERALVLDAWLIGINNRDLNSFQTRLETTERLVQLVPPGRLIVSESGIFTAADISRLMRVGAGAFLVGESLMRQSDVEAATRKLLSPAPQLWSPGASA